MSELERDSAAPEVEPASAGPSAAVSSAPHVDAPTRHDDDAPAAHDDAPPPGEPELEQLPIWDDPNDSDPEPYPEHSDDAWAFRKGAAEELYEPSERTPAKRKPGLDGTLESALVGSLFRPNVADLLGVAERALRALPRAKPTAQLLELVSRARATKATEPRVLETLLRAYAAGRVTSDFDLLAVLLTRRLVLPSLRAEPRVIATSLRVRLLREVGALLRRVSRARGDEGLRELARLSTQVGARASERGRALDELVPLLRRRFERAESTATRPALEAELRGSRRTRRFRLPGRVEIVIYEE